MFVTNPSADLELPKIALLNTVNRAHADGAALVVYHVASRRARALTDDELEAATGFGGLFDEGEGS